MGQSLSELIEEKERDEKTFKEALHLRKIERTMRQKFEENKARMYIDALNDECLPIICAVDKFYEFLVNVEKVDGAPEEDAFDIGKKLKKHLHGDYLTELITLLGGVLGNVLDTQTTGVVEERQTHVVYANRSVIRIDYYLYYTKISVGGSDFTALFYYVQVGVIDMTRVRLPVLIYELTRATESQRLGEAGKALKGIANSSLRLHEAVQTLSDAARFTHGATITHGSTVKNDEPPKEHVEKVRQQEAGVSSSKIDGQ